MKASLRELALAGQFALTFPPCSWAPVWGGGAPGLSAGLRRSAEHPPHLPRQHATKRPPRGQRVRHRSGDTTRLRVLGSSPPPHPGGRSQEPPGQRQLPEDPATPGPARLGDTSLHPHSDALWTRREGPGDPRWPRGPHGSGDP